MKKSGQAVFVAGLFFFVLAAVAAFAAADFDPETVKPKIIRRIPHDTSAFTQGLIFLKGRLYESTGNYGASTLRRIDPESGIVEKIVSLGNQYFGEGLAFLEGKIVVLTWHRSRALIYSFPGLEPAGKFSYKGEGWGLTVQGKQYVMSNGSAELLWRNRDFSLQKKVKVTISGAGLAMLNELEFARGKIYANVWFSDRIFEIDPGNGRVLRTVDCSELVSQVSAYPGIDVFNGIAFAPDSGTFFVTGKYWPYIFEITF